MIAKRILRPAGTSSFKELARYTVDAPKGVEPDSWGLGAYVLDEKHEGEKVAWARVSNCAATDPGWAVKEIEGKRCFFPTLIALGA